MASICSIGVAVFENGAIESEWHSLVDPKDFFAPANMSVHDIKEADVRGAPTFKGVAVDVERLLGSQVVVTHTHFDRVAMHQAAVRWGIPTLSCTWVDTARVARRIWAERAKSGYGLKSICKKIGYEFDHHNALEDAKAAGHVMLAAMKESGLDLEAIQKRAVQPIDPSPSGSKAVTRDGNPNGAFAGEVIVFTGALEMARHEAADFAAFVGCDVTNNVTKKTTILVVGDVDIRKLAGHDKSTKQRKAEQLIKDGQQLRIIRETDFKAMVALS